MPHLCNTDILIWSKKRSDIWRYRQFDTTVVLLLQNKYIQQQNNYCQKLILKIKHWDLCSKWKFTRQYYGRIIWPNIVRQHQKRVKITIQIRAGQKEHQYYQSVYVEQFGNIVVDRRGNVNADSGKETREKKSNFLVTMYFLCSI